MRMSFTRLAVGALTGLVGLIAMIRLISGGFDGRVSMLAWAFILLAMIPWVAYTAWRGQRSRMSGRAALVATALGVAGLVLVWMSTLGPVLALTCSLAAFVVLWVHDWPPRRLRVADHFVGVEDLADRD